MPEQFIDYPDAAMRFVSLVAAAEGGELITIMRDGDPVAVVIGVDEFDRLTAAVEALAR